MVSYLSRLLLLVLKPLQVGLTGHLLLNGLIGGLPICCSLLILQHLLLNPRLLRCLNSVFHETLVSVLHKDIITDISREKSSINKYCPIYNTYPWFKGGEAQPDPNTGLVGIHHRVIMDVLVVTDTYRLIVVLLDAVERINWLCKMGVVK